MAPTAQHSTRQHSTAQHSTAQLFIVCRDRSPVPRHWQLCMGASPALHPYHQSAFTWYRGSAPQTKQNNYLLTQEKKQPGPRGLGMGLPDQTDFKTHSVVDIRDKSSSKAFDQAHQHSTHLHFFRPKLAYLCIDFDPILLLKVHPLTLVRFWGASGQTLGPMPNA